MTERYRQRQEAVMAEFRPKPVIPGAVPQPGETPGQTRERQNRGWLYLRGVMARTGRTRTGPGTAACPTREAPKRPRALRQSRPHGARPRPRIPDVSYLRTAKSVR